MKLLQPCKNNDEKAIIFAFKLAKKRPSAILYEIVIRDRVFPTSVYNQEYKIKKCFNYYKYRHHLPQCINQTSCCQCAKMHSMLIRHKIESHYCKKYLDNCVVYEEVIFY